MLQQVYVARTALIVALGGFLMGFDASVISGVVGFIETEFSLSSLELGWAVASLTLTATLAMLVAGPLSDAIGRRAVLYGAAVLYAVSAIGSALAPSFLLLVIARMIGGLGVGASLIIAPMYIAELSPPALRGRMVSFNQLNIVIGISVAFFTNYLILQLGDSQAAWAQSLMFGPYNWRWMLGLETLPAILYFFALFAVPESPRWLVMKGRSEEGLAIMVRASGEKIANNELANVQASLQTEKAKEKAPILALLAPSLRLVLLIGVVIAILQQIVGINAVFFYAPMIFEQSGIGTDASFMQAIFVGLTNLVFTLVAIALIDRLGRKPLLIIGLAGITVAMAMLAYGFSSATYTLTAETSLPAALSVEQLSGLLNVTFESDIDFKSAIEQALGAESAMLYQSDLIAGAIRMNPTLILTGILGFVAAFAVSVGPVMWVLFSELFPNRVRGLAISVVGLINSGVSFLVQLVFPWELDNLGSSMTFLIYGVFAAMGLVFVIMVLPETKGKSLEELEAKLASGKRKPAPHLAIIGMLICAGWLVSGCQTEPGPAHVEVRQIDGRYMLHVNDEPFYINGAGLEFGDIERLAQHGANSFRTWRTDNGRDTGMEVLDRAHANGLMVTMGLDIARERPGSGRGVFGFNYDDSAAVAAQLAAVREEVLMYKDHPALLMWGIGNELNLGASNPRVWDAVNEISEMIHEVDGHHPTTTMLAGIGPELAEDIKSRAPDLDLLSIQMYADIVNLPRYLDESGWDGPYMVTEWGATGHWEVPSTPWGAPIENNSTVKAEFYDHRYQIAIASDTVRCLGSYVFLWGQKQERTPTWYGLFTADGSKTAAVDVMHRIWNGAWPDNQAPALTEVTFDERTAADSIVVTPGISYTALVDAFDPDGDTLTYRWEILPESTDLGHGGDDEAVPEAVSVSIDPVDSPSVTAPDNPGPYRLFIYVSDGQGNAAHANIPFLVADG